MHEIILKRQSVRLYAEIEEMPIRRYNVFNKYLFIDSEVGSDLTDLNKRLSNLAMCAENKEKLARAIDNLYMLFGFLEKEVNVKQLAFASLVQGIGTEDCFDISAEGLKRTLQRLSDLGLTQAILKKKLKRCRKIST
jgi:hypothetical protein